MFVRDAEVAGSNPVASTKRQNTRLMINLVLKEHLASFHQNLTE